MAQRIVSPDLKLYIVNDEEALRDLVKALELGLPLDGNLKQLCGWAQVGADRLDRKEAANWQRLESVRWLMRDNSDELVPLVGKYQWMFDSVVQQRDDMDFPLTSLKKLLNGKYKHLKGWRVVRAPVAAWSLQNGASLVGLSDDGRSVAEQVLALIANA